MSEASASALPRNKEQTKTRILDTVERLLVEEGFSSLGINRIAADAGVAKVLIYRYFGDLEGLLGAFVRTENFWPTRDEIIDLPLHDFYALELRSRIKRVMFNFISGVARRPQTLAILAWEMSGNARLTRLMEDALGEFADQLVETLTEPGTQVHPLLPTMLAIISAGMTHLGLAYHNHQRYVTQTLETRDDWRQVMKACALLLDAMPLEALDSKKI